MEQPQVFVSFFLDASRPNANGKCLVKLNIYHKPHKQRYGTKFHLTKDEWEKLNSSKLRDEDLKEIKRKFNFLKFEAEEVIEKIHPFSFVAFEEAFINLKPTTAKKGRMLEEWFNDTIKRLKSNDQVGTAGSYQTTTNSIKGFRKSLQVQDITPAFLQSYEKNLLNEGKSASTIGIYMRNLRAIINEAILPN